MKTLASEICESHSWLSEEKSHWLVQTRLATFAGDLQLEGNELSYALESSAHIYKQMSEGQLRDTISRFEEFFT